MDELTTVVGTDVNERIAFDAENNEVEVRGTGDADATAPLDEFERGVELADEKDLSINVGSLTVEPVSSASTDVGIKYGDGGYRATSVENIEQYIEDARALADSGHTDELLELFESCIGATTDVKAMRVEEGSRQFTHVVTVGVGGYVAGVDFRDVSDHWEINWVDEVDEGDAELLDGITDGDRGNVAFYLKRRDE